MKLKLLGLVFLLLGFGSANAQLGRKNTDIIKEHGHGYTVGVKNNGVKYISYEKEMRTKTSGKYIRKKTYYLKKSNEGAQICFSWTIFEPVTEKNAWIVFLDNNYSKTKHGQWKDYKSNIVFNIYVAGKYCIITSEFDN